MAVIQPPIDVNGFLRHLAEKIGISPSHAKTPTSSPSAYLKDFEIGPVTEIRNWQQVRDQHLPVAMLEERKLRMMPNPTEDAPGRESGSMEHDSAIDLDDPYMREGLMSRLAAAERGAGVQNPVAQSSPFGMVSTAHRKQPMTADEAEEYIRFLGEGQ